MTIITVTGVGLVEIPKWSTSTNLGPLPTTTFPADCLSSLWDFNTRALGMPWTQMTQGCAVKTCCPYGNVYTEAWAWMTSYYSPGVCPEQYKSCPGPDSPSALSTDPGETIAFCCPTNYGCPSSGFYQYCQSPLSQPTEVVVMDNIFDQKTLSISSWTLSSINAFSWQAVYPIQVRARAGDFQPTSTSQFTRFSQSTGVSQTTGASDESTSALKSSNTTSDISSTALPTGSGGSKLSNGAIIGIAIGVAIPILIIGLFIGFRLGRRRDDIPVVPIYNDPENKQWGGIISEESDRQLGC